MALRDDGTATWHSDRSGGAPPPAQEMGTVNLAFHGSQDELQETGKPYRTENAMDDREAVVSDAGPKRRWSASKDYQDGPRDHDQDHEDEDDHLRCGWWVFKPDCLQRFRTAKWALFWLCFAGGVQGMVVNGFVNVVITTIERRFGLRSSQTGLIAGGYDIASFLCLVPVTYLGGRPGASKPRWLGWGVVLMGCGSLVFALPHLLAGPYRGVTHTLNTCDPTNSTVPPYGDSRCDRAPAADAGQLGLHLGSTSYMWLFLLGQLLHGAGAAPLFTLGVTFIDENVSKKMSSVYLGIYYTMAVVGPALGYVIGGQLLQLYTDFLSVDPAELGLTPLSNVWVGAWWIGFVIAAVVCILLAIPLLAFPAEMPGAAELRAEKVCEAHGSSSTAEAFSKLHEMPRAVRTLMGNPAFFFLNMAGASEGLILAGFAAFLPKLIENQFSVAASRAALLMGLVTVPAGGGGTFLGGYVVKRFNMNCAAIIKLCVVTAVLGLLCTISFVISCPNVPFAGISRPYADADNVTSRLGTEEALSSACNAGCRCRGVAYDPVCGADNILYFSPCHAGCIKETALESAKVYSDCSCVSAQHVPPLEPPLERRRRYTRDVDATNPQVLDVEYDAINEPCTSSCNLLWLFIVLAFVTMVFTFLVTMPALTATLRCVTEEQRSFALGIQWIKVRLLGTIPAPMIFGLLIDETCVLWQTQSCSDNNGSCVAYDNFYMSRYMLALAFIGKACSLLFFFLAWKLYKPPQSLLSQDQNQKSEMDPASC